MTFDDEMADCFEDSADLLGKVTFTINGNSYDGVFNENAKGEADVDLGGFLPECDATLVCGLTQFSGEPAVGANITIGTTAYRIESVHSDSISYTLGLKLRVR